MFALISRAIARVTGSHITRMASDQPIKALARQTHRQEKDQVIEFFRTLLNSDRLPFFYLINTARQEAFFAAIETHLSFQNNRYTIIDPFALTKTLIRSGFLSADKSRVFQSALAQAAKNPGKSVSLKRHLATDPTVEVGDRRQLTMLAPEAASATPSGVQPLIITNKHIPAFPNKATFLAWVKQISLRAAKRSKADQVSSNKSYDLDIMARAQLAWHSLGQAKTLFFDQNPTLGHLIQKAGFFAIDAMTLCEGKCEGKKVASDSDEYVALRKFQYALAKLNLDRQEIDELIATNRIEPEWLEDLSLTEVLNVARFVANVEIYESYLSAQATARADNNALADDSGDRLQAVG